MLEKVITHKEHGKDGIQTLEFTDKSGIDHQVGVIPPGEYNFGLAKRTEIVRVLSGSIIIKGEVYNPEEKFTVLPGQEISFSTHEISSYISHYPKTEEK